jgi:hypothetical protein
MPEGVEKQEGTRVLGGSNPPIGHRGLRSGATLRSTRRTLAPGNRQAGGANDARVLATDEVVRPGRRKQTPEARTLDMAAQRNRCARHEEEQAVASVRNAEDGTSPDTGHPANSGLHVLMS